MAFVRTGMYGDPLRTKCFTISGNLGEIGLIGASGIADQRNFVDVDT